MTYHPDAFFTPTRLTWELLLREDFPEPVWESACGAGHISRVLTALQYRVVSSDVLDYGYPRRHCDFLADAPPGPFSSIVTNPPFSTRLIRPWVRRSCAYRPEKLALLLPVQGGFEDMTAPSVVGEMGLKRVVIPDRRLAKFSHPDGRKAFSPQWSVGWFVLERGYKGDAAVTFLRG